jgi:hypothetical protein
MLVRTGAARRIVVGAVLAAALVAAMAAPAPALSPLPITCTATGTVAVVDGTPTDAWSLVGKGSCQGDLSGTYFVDFVGTGTSETRGICDQTLVVREFNVLITGTLTSFKTGLVTPLLQEWFAQVTTYPLGTPFLIATDDGKIGAGVFFNHIFLNCQGTPVAQFTWTQMT